MTAIHATHPKRLVSECHECSSAYDASHANPCAQKHQRSRLSQRSPETACELICSKIFRRIILNAYQRYKYITFYMIYIYIYWMTFVLPLWLKHVSGESDCPQQIVITNMFFLGTIIFPMDFHCYLACVPTLGSSYSYYSS